MYTGLAGIGHAYLHLYERLAALPESHQGRHSQGLQMLAASREDFLLKATEMAELARAHQEVQDLNNWLSAICWKWGTALSACIGLSLIIPPSVAYSYERSPHQ